MHASVQVCAQASVWIARKRTKAPRDSIFCMKDHSEIAAMGAAATNKLLTKKKRREAAKKGWINRRKREAALSKKRV